MEICKNGKLEKGNWALGKMVFWEKEYWEKWKFGKIQICKFGKREIRKNGNREK